MPGTFEIDVGKGVLDIDIYNFIRASQNDIYRWRCVDLHNDAIMLS